LLSTPIIAGAAIHHLPKWFKAPPENLSLLAASLGFVAAVLSSYLAIKFLMRFLQRHTFIPFVVYRLALAAVVLVLVLLGRG
jgi:undecaprenyl-diphosphatase